MTSILGVDCGGSKTHAVIVDETGLRRGEGFAKSGNHQIVGVDQAIRNISGAINQALSGAGLSKRDIAFTQFGIAGFDRPQDGDLLRPGLEALSLRPWDMVTDTLEGLRTGSPDNTGVVLICGNGTNAAGRNRSGTVLQVGGTGYLYGDCAGSTYMATLAFRAAVRSWEGREIPSLLTEKIPRYFGFSGMEKLVNDFLDRGIFSIREPGLSPVVHEAANEGDTLACRILEDMGAELGGHGNTVIRRLGDFGEGAVTVVLIGGVLQKGRSPVLLEKLSGVMRFENPDVEIVIPEMAPVYGSVLLAMDRLGINVGPGTMRRFDNYGGYVE